MANKRRAKSRQFLMTLNTTDQALDDFHEAEQVSVALFNKRAVLS
jgi:hypothetical protein